MGEIVIAVNSINDKFAHAFIEVRTATVVASKLLSRVAVRKFDREVAPKHFACRSCSKSAAAVFLGAAITFTPVHADTGKYFEKWTKSEGFDVGYACNWWKDVPGPESMFEVKKMKSAETLVNSYTSEFRMIKPNTPDTGEEFYEGSNFDIRFDRTSEKVSVIRIIYSMGGFCGYIVKAEDGSEIQVLRGVNLPFAPPSRKALRWIDRTISECHRRLRRAVDPNLIFDCVVSRDQDPSEGQPTEGLLSSFMPEEVVPASVARVYLENRGKTFAVTTFGDTIELVQIGAQP